MIDLFRFIQSEHARITGWCPKEKAFDLVAAVLALRPNVVLETGVWGGRSLIPMAMALQFLNRGIVIGIDPWSPQASIEGYSGPNQDWWSRVDHEGVYKQFISDVQRLHLNQFVSVVRAKSDKAACPNTIDILHLDSQHTDQASREVEKFASRVRVGGVCFLDDLSWHNGDDMPVQRAIEDLFKIGFIELFRKKQDDGEWGAFQRVKK